MNQEFNAENRTNRFIFSDDFYDKLDSNNISKEENNNVNYQVMQPINEIENNKLNNEIIINDESFINIPSTNINNINKSTKEQLENIVISEIVEPVSNDELNINIPQINNDNEIIKEEFVQQTPTIKIEDTKNYDATPQMNKEIEQEIMKLNVENQAKSPIVQQGRWFDEQKEKQVYRAVRNNHPINIQTYNEPEESITININPQLAEINKLFKQPEVINIDELLKQEVNTEIAREFNYLKEVNEDLNLPVIKSDLIQQLKKKEIETGKISILARYGEDFCERDYVTNPAIGRNEEIKELILILLTPEKSGILVGKPGIGKTAIVEGLAYRLQRNKVPDALKGYRIVSVKTTSLLGTLPNGETRLQTLIDELKDLDKIILFMDEIHMLMGATSDSSLDFANMFKESLGRGSIKMIGATTNDEYERYVLRDKAFVRRFQRVDVEEPSREHTIEILMGSLPKLEKTTGVKLNYSEYIKSEIMGFIVDITTEYKRVYGIGSRYPDICLTLLSQAFSQAVFDNRKEVDIFDVRTAIENSKNIYPDVIRKELVNFDKKFKNIIEENSIV